RASRPRNKTAKTTPCTVQKAAEIGGLFVSASIENRIGQCRCPRYCVANAGMLLCKQMHCLWHLVYIDCSQTTRRPPGCAPGKGTNMAKTAAIGFAPNTPLIARLLAAIDRALTASARISLRNGDLPRFGL